MNSVLDLELLRTFIMVSRTGELKKAAQAVHRSQGAVSMQMKRLEEMIGSRLLERSNKGIQLTDAGETLLSYSEQMLKLNGAALSALSRNDLSGELKFGIPTDYAHNFLQFFMPVLASELPNLSAKIICDRSRQLRQLIDEGQLDIAIVAGEEEASNELLLWSERLLWSAPASIKLEEQSPMPIAMFEDNCIVRDLCLNDLKQAKIPYQIVFGSPVMENLATAVEGGFAVSLLPESLLKPNKTRTLAESLIKSRYVIRMNMIHSQEFDEKTLDIVSSCMRTASDNQKRDSYLS